MTMNASYFQYEMANSMRRNVFASFSARLDSDDDEMVMVHGTI